MAEDKTTQKVEEAVPSRSKKPNLRLIRMVQNAAGLVKPGKAKPLFPDNGLSIVERVFYNIPNDKPQVIMTIALGFRLPESWDIISEERIIELLKAAATKHHRACSSIEPNTMTTQLLGMDASNIQILTRFVVGNRDAAMRKKIFEEEVNTNFDTNDLSKPLWRVTMLGPAQMVGKGFSQQSNKSQGEFPVTFDMFFSFHHCIGDGLSMLAFARTFLSYCNAKNFNSEIFPLHAFLCDPNPPPVLDNLILPGVLGILRPAFSLAWREMDKSRIRRFKGLYGVPEESLQNNQGISETGPLKAAEHTADAQLMPRKTKIRNLRYNEEFVFQLRKNSKQNGTTIAAVLLVTALASVRAAFFQNALKQKRKLPSKQAWVVTNSMRHLLPNSGLLTGADKQADPSISVMGGYGGSVADANFTVVESCEFWERCRTVRRRISNDFFASMRRMKMMNWVYRHPKIWEFFEKKADINKLTRGYSVELANLGVWDYPVAPPNAPEDDPRFRTDWFQGSQSCSFDGARGLFSLAVVTLGNDMSVSIAYDAAAITEHQADLFEKAFDNGITLAKNKSEKIKIKDMTGLGQ